MTEIKTATDTAVVSVTREHRFAFVMFAPCSRVGISPYPRVSDCVVSCYRCCRLTKCWIVTSPLSSTRRLGGYRRILRPAASTHQRYYSCYSVGVVVAAVAVGVVVVVETVVDVVRVSISVDN